MKTVFKPWGKEEWLELNDKYCYKRIYINAGYKTSYQYHQTKRETNYIISGEAEIWLENDKGVVEKRLMGPGEYFNVTPPRKHRVIAITDLILQEVSTPEVDDVFRIEDDTCRAHGRIPEEHLVPGVLILAAGVGSRLGPLTANLNKALLPVGNEPVISRIIKKFPANYKFVIATGYRGSLVEEYCKIVFPTYDITFVEVDDFSSEESGPGKSALCCKHLLQRPFYLSTADCLVVDEIPPLASNWLGVHRTFFPEKYSTAKVENGVVVDFANKGEKGHELAFVGVAGIVDYSVFWSELENNIKDGEVVCAFDNPNAYKNLRGKDLRWLDTGNYDDLEKARSFFNDKPLSLSKTTQETVYRDSGKLVKFIPKSEDLESLKARASFLGTLVPKNVRTTRSFLYYDWEPGKTLYERDSLTVYENFIKYYLDSVELIPAKEQDLINFYRNKTAERYTMFLERNSPALSTTAYTINGVPYPSMEQACVAVSSDTLLQTFYTKNFHGDLQFDNIVEHQGKFTYIDWRRNFGSSNTSGDVYYDLAKMYGGILIPYHLMKDENNITLIESDDTVTYAFKSTENLSKAKPIFEKLITEAKYDLRKIELLTGLIFLNMAPMHSGKFSKLLWYRAIEILSGHAN